MSHFLSGGILPFHQPAKQFLPKRVTPARAPAVGEHNDAVLANVLGYDADRIAKLKDSGALG